MKKLFLTLTALCAMSTAAWAEYDGYTGGLSQGAVLEWKLPHEGGTMIIFGEDYNPMNDFIPGDATFGTPWSRDNDLAEKIQAINMQKGINIGKYAFSNLPNLESISIHGVGTNTKALFCIGNYAFANSPKFTTINSETLSELRYIGAEAFKGTAIKSFTIDKPVGGNLPAYLTTEQGYGIDLNREHCYIGANAFAACDHLTTLYMKDDTPFADTYNNFLNDHTYLVVDNADVAATFRTAWPEIASQVIYMAQSVTFENETFKDICISHWDTNGDGELSYEEAFAVTSFGDAFKGNTELKEITLNDLMPFVNVTTYESGVFEGCTSLEKITIPPYVTDIADDAFTGCTSLKEIHFVSATPFKESFTIVTNERTHIIVPDAYLPTYDAQWADKSELIIGESHIPFQCTEVKTICVSKWDTNKDGEVSYEEANKAKVGTEFQGKAITSFDEFQYFNLFYSDPEGPQITLYAFKGCNKLKSITLPNKEYVIMDQAFMNCTSLKHIEIPNTVKDIRGNVFNGCSGLTSVTLPDNLQIIPGGTFLNCYKLSSITIPNSVVEIQSRAFESCRELKSVHISSLDAWWNIKFGDNTSYPVASDGNLFLNGEVIEDIIVPNSITSIDRRFSNCKGLKSVTMSENVTSLTDRAFSGCSSLAHITLPNVSTIGSNAFADCRSLVSVTMPNIITIGNSAFSNCSALTSITIPEGVTKLENMTFRSCTSLKEVIFEDANSTLELGYDYDGGTSANAEGRGLFYYCPLETLYLGRNISYSAGMRYGYSPFATITTLKNLTNGDAVTSIPNYLFYGCNSLTSANIPNVTTVGNYAFCDCNSLASTNMPNVSTIGNYAFQNCNSLTSINMPNVSTIGNYAFQNCNKHCLISLPNSITSIGSNAFNNMPTVIFNAMNPSPATYNSFSSTAIFIVPDDAVEAYRTAWSDVAHRITSKSALEWKEVTCEAQPTSSHLAELIGVGNELDVVKLRISGTINSYDMMVMRNKMQNLRELDLTNATIVANSFNYGTGVSEDNVFPDFMKGKPLTNILLPESITRIGGYALYDCDFIKEITIPANVTSIDNMAFNKCDNLSALYASGNSKLKTINASFQVTTSLKYVDLSQALQLETIGKYAFNESAITSISLPTSLKSIGDNAFYKCKNLLSFTTTANIGNNAFEGCEKMHSFASFGNIGEYAFKGCYALKTVTIQEGASTIGAYAFDNVRGLETVNIGKGVRTISEYAFRGCSSLKTVSLPESLNSLGTYAFSGCEALTSITIPDAVTSLGTYAFNGCTALEKAEIGMGITSVPQNLFSGCTKLKDVKLSPKTTTIQSNAFQNCTGLTEFHLPPYLTSIGSGAFSGCSNLTEIYAYMPDVPAIAASTFSNYLTSTLYAPAFLFNAYYYDSGWNQFLHVKRCDLRPGDFEAFYTNKDLLFKEGEERITADRPIVELGAKGSIIVEGANQEFTTVDMLRGASTSSSLIGDGNIPMDELRVKVEVSANRWYFLCFPYDVAIDGCEYPGKYAWRYYDGATRAANGNGGWQKIEGDVLKAGVGYIFQSNTAGNLIVKFAEPEFGGDRPTTLAAYNSTNAANASWNFVGNPYACYYNFESDDFASPITVWNGSTYIAYRPGDDDYHLQPYEAFFVQKTEDASAVNFDADRRETYSQSVATATAQARARRQRGITPERLIVNLTISDNDTAIIDRTRYVMNDKASRSYELACDASKFISDDAAAQLYTLEGNVKMAINERPGDGEVRIGYTAQKAGTLRIEAQRMDMPMEIIDTETDRTFDLSKGAYEFTTKAGTFDNRFVVRASRAATEIMNLTAATGVAIGMQEGGLSIGGAEGKSVSIYAANGALVAERSGNGYVALTAGTYVVKVDGHSAKMYVK